jgi:hypothetical protein
MNRKLASTLAFTSTAAAVLAFAAIASGNAYADDITIDHTPFVSSKSRAEVQAEVTGQAGLLGKASSEWAMQQNGPSQSDSAFAREAAKAEYIASRNEVNARNSEDGGSSYSGTFLRTGTSVMGGPAR